MSGIIQYLHYGRTNDESGVKLVTILSSIKCNKLIVELINTSLVQITYSFN